MELSMVPARYRLRVKQHLAIVKYVEEHNVRAAARRFGLTRGTVRLWRNRWRAEGILGLVPRYAARRRARRVTPEMVALLKRARTELRYGSGRAKIWLERVHGVRLTATTIQRVFRDLGMPRLRRTKRREPRQLLLFEKENPGDSVQVDVKVVKTAEGRSYQYTALDDCTRYRLLRLYHRCNERTGLAFLREIRSGMPFPIRKLQTGQRLRVLPHVLPLGAAGWDSPSLHQASLPAAEREGRAQPPDRQRGVLGPPGIRDIR